eukprot:CAMPEP_0170936050 /NCGR_PEP_ID=MMETSP0735-20130129/19518_1 /TAXON_ID=186038 /ORGANISM="Fragilariopsis kerguelensis, Strain L26-C5" /LENGTH=57 /DNA_ID=CAMNT_0011339987 /DNA_START=13 /DNA_END=183 /DNA_ORIENTATION=+
MTSPKPREGKNDNQISMIQKRTTFRTGTDDDRLPAVVAPPPAAVPVVVPTRIAVPQN